MDELIEYLNSQIIQYDIIANNVVSIEGFGVGMFADTESKKSVFRTFKIDDKEEVHLNIMNTKDELRDSGIQYIFFKFANEWNYVDIDDNKLEFYPLVNVGLSLLPLANFDYVNLGCHTGMELLNGSANPDRWIQRAKFLGHKYIGICDFNTLGNTLNLQKECDKAGIQPVFGYSTLLNIDDSDAGVNIKVYAKGDNGFKNLLRIHKNVAVDNSETNKVDLEALLKHGKDCVLVIGKQHADWVLKNEFTIDNLKKSFDSIYFQIDFNEYRANRLDIEVLESLKLYFHNIYKKKDIDPILITDCYYVNKHEYKNKITLNKISIGAAHNQSNQQWYKTIDEHIETMKPLFDSSKWDIDALIKECADNTVKLASQCTAKYRLDINYMPRYDMTPEEQEKYGDPETLFDELLEDGFKKRVPKGQEDIYRERLEYEKYVIKSTNNVNYMLVQRDTINFTIANDIATGAGRGSAGGSLILFLLGITHVDPVKRNLLFERFLLPERAGLYEAQVTKVAEKVDDAPEVAEIEFEDGRKIVLDLDSQVLVEGQDRAIYADELNEGMDVVFDNIDNLFKIK